MFHKTTQYRQLDTATLLLACGFFVKDIYSILASSNNFSKEFALCLWVYYDTRLVVLLYILRQDVACLFGWILHHHLDKEKWHQEYMKPQDFLILLLYPNMQPQLPNLSNQRIRPERMSKFISYFSIKMAKKTRENKFIPLLAYTKLPDFHCPYISPGKNSSCAMASPEFSQWMLAEERIYQRLFH